MSKGREAMRMKVALPVRVLLLFKTVHTTNNCAPRRRDSLGVLGHQEGTRVIGRFQNGVLPEGGLFLHITGLALFFC